MKNTKRMKKNIEDYEKEMRRKYEMVARSQQHFLENRKNICTVQNVAYDSATFQRRDRIKQRYKDAGRKEITKRKGRIGRVDRNKSDDITEDKARRIVRGVAL